MRVSWWEAVGAAEPRKIKKLKLPKKTVHYPRLVWWCPRRSSTFWGVLSDAIADGRGRGAVMDWARILVYITGTVDQELLARNEYLAAENLIPRAQLKGRLKLSDAKRPALGEIGHRLGRKVLGEVATVAPAGHHPGLVPQASRPQVRWLEGP